MKMQMNVTGIYRLINSMGVRYPRPADIKTIGLLYPCEEPEEKIMQEDGTDLVRMILVLILGILLGLVLGLKKGFGKGTVVVAVVTIVAVICVPAIRKQNRKKALETRKQALESSFCELTSKLAVLIGAGLSGANCWERIVSDYSRDREVNHIPVNPLYEEMILSVRLMKQGIPEGEMYIRFGERIGLPAYLRLVSLLDRGRRNGGREIREALSIEARESFSQRLRAARQSGEKLTSKMLLPMMMLFILVLSIIMVPAFMSW